MSRVHPRGVTRRTITALAATTIALTILPALPASAGMASGHSGQRGVHLLLDNTGSEIPSQNCQYQGPGDPTPGLLKRIAVRRPVIFAPDITSGRDQRWVGWRFRLMQTIGKDTVEVKRSSVAKAVAYDDRPAALEPRGRNLTGVDGATYYTVVDFYWFTKNSSTDQTGKGSHTSRFSEYSGPVSTIVNGDCPGKLTLTAGGGPSVEPAGGGSHRGVVGLHTLIDVPGEYPGATCVFNDDELIRIKVRAPVMWAQRGTVGEQDVRWRYEVYAADEPSEEPELIHQSAWTTAAATDLRAARWSGRTQAVDGSDFEYWLVRVRMQWLGSDPKPYALHAPYHRMFNGVFGYCTGSVR